MKTVRKLFKTVSKNTWKKSTMFLGGKTQYWKDVNSPQLIYNFHATSINIPTGLFMELNEQSLKFIWKRKYVTAKKTLQKNHKRKFVLPVI